MIHMHPERPQLNGHILVRRKSNYAHVVQFVPSEDKAQVTVSSWNAPVENKSTKWILISRQTMKVTLSRILWKEMRSRGYWIGTERPQEVPDASC